MHINQNNEAWLRQLSGFQMFHAARLFIPNCNFSLLVGKTDLLSKENRACKYIALRTYVCLLVKSMK